MTERVEEIRRLHAGLKAAGCQEVPLYWIDDLLDRLAQAEREREEWKHECHDWMNKWRDDLQEARAEVERLKEENARMQSSILRAAGSTQADVIKVEAARAEAEQEGQRLSDVATFQLDRAEKLQAEVERLDIQASREMHRANQAESERDRAKAALARVRAALEPFKSGEWGAVKAWIVNGAPTREEGLAAAQWLTALNAAADAALGDMSVV